MANGEKICVLCGQSCAGQARIKNEKGQYAHQACVKAKQEQQAPVESHSGDELYDDAYSDSLGGGMDDLLGDLNEENTLGGTSGCPGCGQRMGDDAVVCLGCGYNSETGRSMTTKSKEAKAGPGVGGAALGGAAAVGGFAAGPTLAFVGAVIGGVIGAVIWAAIAYFTGFEIGWIAIGVGVLVGLGAQLGGGSETTGGGMLVGLMSAIVAAGAIAGGKYGASYMFVQDTFGSSMNETYTLEDIDEEWIYPKLVDDICQTKIADGETIEWDKQLFADAAAWPDDYPESIQDMVNEKWDGLDSSERIALRKGFADEVGFDVSYQDIDEEWALSTMAYKATSTMIESGETIEWPNPNLAMEAAFWPDDYPDSIQTLTTERWSAMSEDEQIEFKTRLVDSANEMQEIFAETITQGTFIGSFMHPLDLLFLILAMGAAYKIGYDE